MNKKWHLYFIMWVSGAGKWTVLNALKSEDSTKYQFLKSYVTRRMRPWEVNGDIYWFISKEDFEEWIENNEFLEYEINHKIAYYGTKNSEVFQWLEDWKLLIKEIDTKWLIQLQAKHPEIRERFSSIFLDIPDEVLRKRFFDRNPWGKEQDLLNRIESADFERSQAKQYCDHIVDWSRTPKIVLEEIKKIIEK